ncbi:MAG: hypothetical protein CMP91_10320 [Gammaproteobacteria bacterium]|nr:hypothetical protein [Gammaproteobacteria bacterium]|tara:strand:- start:544 stop:1449 length:906 start_codon:yes stop_codon:yes gene_type:complete
MKKVLLIISFLVVSATAAAQYPVPQQTSTGMNTQERANVQFALEFVRDILNRGNLDIASHYMPEDFTSWNPNIGHGRDAFVDALRNHPQLIQNWDATVPEVIFGKNEYVFIMWGKFVTNVMEPAIIYKYNTIDLLRIEDGQIVEHWDGSRKSVTEDFGKAAGGGVFNDSTNLSAREQETHRLGVIEFRDILQYGQVDLAREYFHPNYMQHNMNVPGGRDEFIEFFAAIRDPMPLEDEWIEPPTLELVSGNFYLKFDQRMEDDPANPGSQSAYYRFDMIRVGDGLIQEHWDVAFPPNIERPY